MNIKNYQKLIYESKQIYMSYQDKYVHEIIKEKIKKYLF